MAVRVAPVNCLAMYMAIWREWATLREHLAPCSCSLTSEKWSSTIFSMSAMSTGDSLRRLMAAKARTGAGDEHSKTPLHLAVQRGAWRAAEALLEGGADVNAKDKFGFTPLLVSHGRVEVIKVLLKNQADVSATDGQGMTALHRAMSFGPKEGLEALLAGGADVSATTRNGWTPLHYAAYAGRREIVALLVDKGADVKAKATDGKTPLQIAQERGKKETAAYLKKASAP